MPALGFQTGTTRRHADTPVELQQDSAPIRIRTSTLRWHCTATDFE